MRNADDATEPRGQIVAARMQRESQQSLADALSISRQYASRLASPYRYRPNETPYGRLLQKNRRRILECVHRNDFEAVRVFGSVLDDSATHQGDLDLLVSRPGIELDFQARVKAWLDAQETSKELEELLRVPVDVIVEETASPKSFKNHILLESAYL